MPKIQGEKESVIENWCPEDAASIQMSQKLITCSRFDWKHGIIPASLTQLEEDGLILKRDSTFLMELSQTMVTILVEGSAAWDTDCCWT